MGFLTYSRCLFMSVGVVVLLGVGCGSDACVCSDPTQCEVVDSDQRDPADAVEPDRVLGDTAEVAVPDVGDVSELDLADGADQTDLVQPEDLQVSDVSGDLQPDLGPVCGDAVCDDAEICTGCELDCGPCLTGGFVLVPAGGFWMGSPGGCPAPEGYPGACEAEIGRKDNELLHFVLLTHDYEMQSTETTAGEWKAAFQGWDPSYYVGCGADCPVDSVSWFDAVAYANQYSAQKGLPLCYGFANVVCFDGTDVESEWLHCMNAVHKGIAAADITVIDGNTPYECKGYRLATEAEWERAARGGGQAAYYASEGNDGSILTAGRTPLDTNLDQIAWYGGNSAAVYEGAADCSSYYPGGVLCGPQPVGGKEPNVYGLFDILGNGWEWTWDATSDYPASTELAPSVDPVNSVGNTRECRGGSWVYGADLARAAYRSDPPASFRGSIGPRLVRTLSGSNP